MHEWIERKADGEEKEYFLLLFVLTITLVYLVASKEAVFVFLSVATQRVFVRYSF